MTIIPGLLLKIYTVLVAISNHHYMFPWHKILYFIIFFILLVYFGFFSWRSYLFRFICKQHCSSVQECIQELTRLFLKLNLRKPRFYGLTSRETIYFLTWGTVFIMSTISLQVLRLLSFLENLLNIVSSVRIICQELCWCTTLTCPYHTGSISRQFFATPLNLTGP
jgi:hypothetical protein